MQPPRTFWVPPARVKQWSRPREMVVLVVSLPSCGLFVKKTVFVDPPERCASHNTHPHPNLKGLFGHQLQGVPGGHLEAYNLQSVP